MNQKQLSPNIFLPSMLIECMFCVDNKYHLNSVPHVAWVKNGKDETRMRIEWW